MHVVVVWDFINRTQAVTAKEAKTDGQNEQDTLIAIESEVATITRISNDIKKAMKDFKSNPGYQAMKEAHDELK